MKVVMLAAGEGKRLRPLTESMPKPLISVAGKPILQYILDELTKTKGLEIALVIGHLGEQIIRKFGSNYNGAKISYIKQTPILGTGHAVILAHNFVREEPFLVYLADTYIVDDLKEVIMKLITKNCNTIVVSRVDYEQAGRSGQVILSGDKVLRIVEKPKSVVSNVVSAGLYYFHPTIFNYLERLFNGKELELTTGIQEALKHEEVRAVFVKGFLDIGTMEGLKAAENYLGRESSYLKN